MLQEYMVKYYDRDEYMGMLGCCGAAISFVQVKNICLESGLLFDSCPGILIFDWVLLT